MIQQIVAIVVTAALSSLFTLALAWWVWERRLADRIERRLAGSLESLGETVRLKVRQGVLEALADAPSLEVIGGAGRTMAGSAADLLRGGLDVILGSPTDADE